VIIVYVLGMWVGSIQVGKVHGQSKLPPYYRQSLTLRANSTEQTLSSFIVTLGLTPQPSLFLRSHTHTYTHTQTHTHTHTHTQAHIHTHTHRQYSHTAIQRDTHTLTRAHTHLCLSEVMVITPAHVKAKDPHTKPEMSTNKDVAFPLPSFNG
jgi:hypothetical protein